jgi:DNA-binding MarR family transcriptional regulator
LTEQASRLEALLPGVMRRLFTLEPGHPIAELPLGQLRVCTLLQHGPQSVSLLADELAISASAITQLADRLERAGLVERTREGVSDRRQRLLRLTAAGEAAMTSRRLQRQERACGALARLDAAQRHQLLESLEALLASSTDERM